MARPTAPLLSFGASGTVAKTVVYSKWKGRPYVRRHVIPSNPNTVSQQSTRGAFSVANAMWLTAPALLVAPWDRFAVGQVLTGRNAFVGRYVKDNRGQVDLANLIFSPGAKGGLPPVSFSAAAGIGEITGTFVTPTPPDGWVVEAVVMAVVKDADPDTTLLTQIDAAEDAAAPFDTVVISGLDTVLYRCGGWIRWAKPDGSIAYSVSLSDSATPT